MLLDGIISHLAADNTVSGLVGAGIYKSVLARGYVLPALAVHRYGGHRDYEFDGPTDTGEDQIQIDAYGKTADEAQQVAQAVRNSLVGFSGALSDGTVVQACYLERDMDMPFLPQADKTGLAFRSVLGFRIVSLKV